MLKGGLGVAVIAFLERDHLRLGLLVTELAFQNIREDLRTSILDQADGRHPLRSSVASGSMKAGPSSSSDSVQEELDCELHPDQSRARDKLVEARIPLLPVRSEFPI